ncbi:MAG: EAL domain-containing protein [Dehalococcoidia bacterium]|nr:EAL domain-containing protein [Dehalococcoidia bacterium]
MTSASSASNLGALAGAAAVRREIHAALETGAFRADCQGIVSLANGDALGFEALTRPASRPPLDTPESFLTAAANEGLLAEVDHTWRVGSIARFGPGFPSERLLFLNVSPLSLLSGHTTAGALESTTRQFGLSPSAWSSNSRKAKRSTTSTACAACSAASAPRVPDRDRRRRGWAIEPSVGRRTPARLHQTRSLALPRHRVRPEPEVDGPGPGRIRPPGAGESRRRGHRDV